MLYVHSFVVLRGIVHDNRDNLHVNLSLCPAGNIQRFYSVISITGHLGLNSGNNKGDCDDSNDNDDMVLMKKTLMLLIRAPHQSD